LPTFAKAGQAVNPNLVGGQDPQGEGAVSAVVLRVGNTLPPNGIETIAQITAEATIPETGSITARLFYVNGKQGSGQPVDNDRHF
jgi:hypothetical protein